MPPLFHTHYVPDIVRCVPPFREISFLEPREITLPEAKDKVIKMEILVCLLEI
jgi:poly(A) RNA polymerase GLD2